MAPGASQPWCSGPCWEVVCPLLLLSSYSTSSCSTTFPFWLFACSPGTPPGSFPGRSHWDAQSRHTHGRGGKLKAKTSPGCINMGSMAFKAGTAAVRHSAQSRREALNRHGTLCADRFPQIFCYQPWVIWGSCTFQFRWPWEKHLNSRKNKIPAF